VATRTEAMKPRDLARLVVDTTVQPKAVMFPTDAKLKPSARTPGTACRAGRCRASLSRIRMADAPYPCRCTPLAARAWDRPWVRVDVDLAPARQERLSG